VIFEPPYLISFPVIPSNYSSQLSTLLRYPPLDPSDNPPEVNHIVLLVRQAAYLREAPTVATGAAIVYENRNILGIDVTVPDKQPEPRFRRSAGNLKSSGTNTQGLPEFAKGILDRGEQVNRTVLSKISGIRVSSSPFVYSYYT
jgi:TBC1 domain family member 5